MLTLSFASEGQSAGRGATTRTAATSGRPTPTPEDKHKTDFESAIATVTAELRSEALMRFVREYPDSERQNEAKAALLLARVAIADEKLISGDIPGATAFYKLALAEAPHPISDEVFAETIIRLPGNLFLRGGPTEAIEIATAIEPFANADPKRLIGLAAFYLNVESGENAERLAQAAAELAPDSAQVFQTLGLAQRLNFDIDGAATSYARALELEPANITTKLDLANMLRAQGKPAEAAALYREIRTVETKSMPALTGLVMSLFESGRRDEAETALDQAIAESPANVTLLAGVAYWHAANGNGDGAVDLADQALRIEPRFIWAHIAMARGQLLQGKPMDADKTLAAARQFGNFPTLEFEIAITRLTAGLYREAAEEIRKSFTVENGAIKTKLGRRIGRSAKTFDELLAAERQASFFASKAAEDRDASARLAALLEFTTRLETPEPDRAKVAEAAQNFNAGNDDMKFHRQIYSASEVLAKRIDPALALELVQAAIPNADAGLKPKQASSAVFASEVYNGRTIAFLRNEYLPIPEIPRQTLSAIARGRIEELAGWAYLQQSRHEDAGIRLRRSISVLPVDSAWWRSAKWRLGDVLTAEGKDEEALGNYIQGYDKANPDIVKYAVISSIYSRVNNGTEGLEDKIGPNPLPAVAVTQPEAVKESERSAEPVAQPDVPATDTLKMQPPDASETKGVESVKQLPVAETATPPNAVPEPEAKQPVSEVAVPDPTAPTPVATASPEKVAEPVDPSVSEVKPTTGDDAKSSDPDQKSIVAKPTPSKSIFEPIIIPIPSSRPRRVDAERSDAVPTVEKGETPKEKTEPIAEPPIEDRAVAEPKGEEPAAPVPVAPCTIEASQDKVSIVNNGGSVGLIVGTDGDVTSINARSESPDDVEIRLEPQIAGVAGRAFYVVKSLSPRKGEFRVELVAPCGQKAITVIVR